MKFKKITLPNGLRIIHIPTKGNPSVTVLVATETGSNYETGDQNGLSHFLEHMCFKGTTTRLTSLDVTREIDSLGAENNAFTSNEITAYHAKGEKKHFSKLLDITSDIYLHPTLPGAELEKERGVILQEISMYEDMPKSKVWTVMAELLYGDQPAGRPTIGPKENIKKFTRKDFVDYRDTHYIADKTIVVVAGEIPEKEVVREVKKYFKNVPKGKRPIKPMVKEKQEAPGLKVHTKKSDQTHMVMAFRTFPATDKRVPALNVLATLLGQGMSSRLFHKLREEMGACYYVKALTEEFTDHGVMAIITGIDVKRTEEITQTLIEECKALTESLVPKEELDKAKEFFMGHLFMQLETTDSLAEFYVDQEVTTHNPKTPFEIEKEIRRVTAEDVRKVAQDIFKNDRLNLAIVGNVKETAGIKKVLKF